MPARILIIEDNRENLELMTYLLEAFGYVTVVAQDGEDGIEMARRESPDLIICDIQLPGISGYDVAQRLKSDTTWHRVPLIAVTALAMVGDRDKALAAEFDGYLPKPISPHTFVQEIEAFLSLEQPSEQPLQTAPPGIARSVKPNKGLILVVDNLQMNRDLANSLLGGFGYAVMTAAGMYEGLESIRRTKPDLILSDVCMGEGSGYDFIKLVKADPNLRSVPFVFITSTMATETERRKGLALGADRFLFRPIDPKILLNEIEACLKGDNDK